MRYCLVLTLLALAACGQVPVTLTYAPTRPLPDPVAMPVIAVAAWPRTGAQTTLGSARGDLGFPAHRLSLPRGAEAQVVAVVQQALTARGLLAPIGAQRFDLVVAVRRLHVGSALARDGDVDLALTLSRHADGRVVYRDTVAFASASLPIVAPTIISLDSMAYAPFVMDDVLASHVVDEAVDHALDNPRFRAALAAPA